MRGKEAKRLRKLVYGDTIPKTQYNRIPNGQIICRGQRKVYQDLKKLKKEIRDKIIDDVEKRRIEFRNEYLAKHGLTKDEIYEVANPNMPSIITIVPKDPALSDKKETIALFDINNYLKR